MCVIHSETRSSKVDAVCPTAVVSGHILLGGGLQSWRAGVAKVVCDDLLIVIILATDHSCENGVVSLLVAIKRVFGGEMKSRTSPRCSRRWWQGAPASGWMQ